MFFAISSSPPKPLPQPVISHMNRSIRNMYNAPGFYDILAIIWECVSRSGDEARFSRALPGYTFTGEKKKPRLSRCYNVIVISFFTFLNFQNP